MIHSAICADNQSESRYHFRCRLTLFPLESSMAAGCVVRGRHAVYLVSLMNI